MANRIKGITVEIGGDTTKLQTALKGVNGEIRNTQSQLKDVEKLLKLDPGNTELLAQRHRLLGESVEAVKEKLETLKTAAEQANAALANGDISQEQYDALQREIIETGNALEELERQAVESATALQQIAATGDKLKTVGAGIEFAGQKLLPVTGAITALGTAAVKTSADFDTAMSKVAAVSGAAGDDFDRLREKAREMGAKTKFSASEAAEAMNYMAMAGWKTEAMLGGIEGIMSLAAASGEDLGTTADIVTDALTALGMTASESGHFADILAAASSNANTNVAMMGENFKYCAPVAGALGYEAEDVAEAIGLMANAGIKSSQAGTAMRTMLTKLQGDIKLTGTNFGEVAVATANTDGSMRELGEIIRDLRGYFTQMTESEAAATAETLVGKNAMSGFLAVMNAAPDDITKLNQAIQNCDGTSEKMAATMQDNLAGQLTILKSQLEELAISFGDLLMPAIRQIVSWVQGFVDKLNGMDEGTKKVIITVGLFVAAIAPVLIVIGKVVGAVGTIMTIVPKIAGVISTVKTAFAALNANPVFLIIAAIAALVAAFIYLWNNCDGFRQFWIGLWENIKEVAVAVWEGLKEFFSAAWGAIVGAATSIWEGLKSFFAAVWDGIKAVFSTVLEVIKTVIMTYFNIYKTVITTVINVIKTVIETVWNAIKTVVETVVSAISAFLTAAWNTIKTIITTVLTAIQTLFTTIWNAISMVVTTVVNAISAFLTAAWEAVRTTITTVLTAIQTIISTVWNAIKSVVITVVNGIKDTVTTVWNSIKTAVSTVVNSIKTVVSTAFNAVWNGIKTVVSGIYNTIKTGFDNAVNFIKNLASSAFSWGADIISGIVDGIKSCIGKIKDAVGDVAETIRSFLHFSVPDEGPLTDYESWMPDFMGGLAKGIEDSRGLIEKAVGSVASDMVISPKVGAMENLGAMQQRNIMNGETADSIVSAITNAMRQFSGTSGDIVIPVYVGGTLLDEVVVGAQARQNLRSGGR